MKWRLSIWSIAVLLVIIILVLNLVGIINLDPWGLFGAALTIFCLWLLAKLFLPEKKEGEEPKK